MAYASILAALGHSEAEMRAQRQALLAAYGVRLTEDDSK